MSLFITHQTIYDYKLFFNPIAPYKGVFTITKMMKKNIEIVNRKKLRMR